MKICSLSPSPHWGEGWGEGWILSPTPIHLPPKKTYSFINTDFNSV
jgi:hypothetical protein